MIAGVKDEDFAPEQRVHLVRSPDGIWAFSPPPIPRTIELSLALARDLSRADQALGELNGTGKHLPNPHLPISPYLRREAVLSSRIEGTQTGLAELFLLEATGEPDGAPTPDAREVVNYVSALEWGLAELPRLPISLRLIRELHRRLTAGVRRADKTPGEFRRYQNFVAPKGTPIERAVYVPPPVAVMSDALGDWERFVHEDDDMPLLLRCALMHSQFESIHPFADGNGRLGRLLIPLLLIERKVLSQPLLYISGSLDRRRDEYYAALMEIRLRGDHGPWFHLFLGAVAEQAREAVDGAERLSRLQQTYHDRFGKTKSSVIRPLIDRLFRQVVVSAPSIAKDFGVTYVTAQAAIRDLVDAGVLREMTGKRRNRAYFASEILSVVMPEEAATAAASVSSADQRKEDRP